MLIQQERENFWMLNWLDEFMEGHKGFICGGCFKNIFNHETVKDIDIFFESSMDFYDAVAYFDRQTTGYKGAGKQNENYQFCYANENVRAYKHIKKNVMIELCCKIYGTAKEILNSFDFTITKFAYYKVNVEDYDPFRIEELVDEEKPVSTEKETHVEYKVMHHDKFFEHLHLKRLVTDENILYPMSTFERMLRYAKYGYFPCRETKMKIIKSLRELSEEQVELSESLYDGMD